MTNVIEMHLDKVAELCRRAGARRLEIFGSAVRPDFDPATSDLDFLVEFDDLPPARYADAFFALKESLTVAPVLAPHLHLQRALREFALPCGNQEAARRAFQEASQMFTTLRADGHAAHLAVPTRRDEGRVALDSFAPMR